MTCYACTKAEAEPLSGAYKRGCRECMARKLARSPAWGTYMYDKVLPLLAEPGEAIESAHARVKRWADAYTAAIRAANEAADAAHVKRYPT